MDSKSPAAKPDPKPTAQTSSTNGLKRKLGEDSDHAWPQSGRPLEKRRPELSHFNCSRDGGIERKQEEQLRNDPSIDSLLSLPTDEPNNTDGDQPPNVPLRPDDMTSQSQVLPPESDIEDTHHGCFSAPETLSFATLQETIESQFNLEILLKHRELRLIDQELAKCQIALEQLRRCHIVPYPAMSSDPDEMQAVSSGVGPTTETQVPHPPPWGVLEGPYSRHYKKWLIRDPAFDADVVEALRPSHGVGRTGSERTTRNSVSEKVHVNGTSRSQRGAASARFQSLSHGYPESKEEKGPMILKRSTDGQMVKLVCLDCRRENFNSAQGFINHCRIAHNRGFASHDAAAIACGEEIEGAPAGNVGGEPSATTNAAAGLVHPLIRSPLLAHPVSSARPGVPEQTRRRRLIQETDCQEKVAKSLSSSMSGPDSMDLGPGSSDSFVPSPETPHLSALFAKKGRGGDLHELVHQAKAKSDGFTDADLLSEDDDQTQDLEEASGSPIGPRSLSTRGPVSGGARLPSRTSTSLAPLERPHSNKGPQGSRKPNPLPNVVPLSMHSSYSVSTADAPLQRPAPPSSAPPDALSTPNLSPNAIESHQAPSLISDDDGDEYENTHSESENPSLAEDNPDEDRFLEFEVEDQGDEMDALGGSASAGLNLTAPVKPHSPAARRSSAPRSPAAIRARHTNDHHVTFAIPGRRPRDDAPRTPRRGSGK